MERIEIFNESRSYLKMYSQFTHIACFNVPTFFLVVANSSLFQLKKKKTKITNRLSKKYIYIHIYIYILTFYLFILNIEQLVNVHKVNTEYPSPSFTNHKQYLDIMHIVIEKWNPECSNQKQCKF